MESIHHLLHTARLPPAGGILPDFCYLSQPHVQSNSIENDPTRASALASYYINFDLHANNVRLDVAKDLRKKSVDICCWISNMVDALPSADTSEESPGDKYEMSMDTVGMTSCSNGSLDGGMSHSYGFRDRVIVSPMMEPRNPPTLTSLECEKGSSHGMKPLKKRRLGAFVSGTTGRDDKATTSPAYTPRVPRSYNSENSNPAFTGVGTRSLDAHGTLVRDGLNRRTGVDIPDAPRRQWTASMSVDASRRPQIINENQSTSINVAKVSGIDDGGNLGEKSARRYSTGTIPPRGKRALNYGVERSVGQSETNRQPWTSRDGRRSAVSAFLTGPCTIRDPRKALSGGYIRGVTHESHASRVEPLKSMQSSPGRSPVDTRAVQFTAAEKKRPELKLKLPLKRNDDLDNAPSSVPRISKEVHTPSGSVSNAKQSYCIGMEKGAQSFNPRAMHEMASNKFQSSIQESARITDRAILMDSRSESDIKGTDVTFVTVNAVAPVSRTMTDIVRETTKKMLRGAFRKQKIVTGKMIRDAPRMESSKTTSTGREFGSVHGVGLAMQLHSPLHAGKAGGNDVAAAPLNVIGDNHINGSGNALEQDKDELRFDDGNGEEDVHDDFTVDDLTYYPAEFGNDDGSDDGAQHDNGADDVEEKPATLGNVEMGVDDIENRDRNNGFIKPVDTNVREGSEAEDREGHRRKRRRLSKLFVSEDDEDVEDPEFVPSKKLRYAVRRMRAQQEKQRQHRSSG